MRQTRLSEGTSRFSAKAQKVCTRLNTSPPHTQLWGWMVIHGKTIKFEESLNVCVKLTFRLSFLSVYAQFIRP